MIAIQVLLNSESKSELLLTHWKSVLNNIKMILQTSIEFNWNEKNRTPHTPLIIITDQKEVLNLNFSHGEKILILCEETLTPYLDISALNKCTVLMATPENIEYFLEKYLMLHFAHLFKNNLDQLLYKSQSKLKLLKDEYMTNMPRHLLDFKRGNAHTKYIAGEKSGGEFFEYISSKYELLFILTGSNKYTFTGKLLTELSKIKRKKEMENHYLYEAAIKLNQQFLNSDRDQDLAPHYFFIFHLDLIHLKETIFELGPKTLVLREEKMLAFISPGTQTLNELTDVPINFGNLINYQSQTLSPDELIHKIFFHLSKLKLKHPFYPVDAVVSIIKLNNASVFASIP